MNDRVGRHVVEAILTHVSSCKSGKAGVAGVYKKALYLRERSEAQQLWADHVSDRRKCRAAADGGLKRVPRSRALRGRRGIARLAGRQRGYYLRLR
jgi:hypothetical protein